MNRERSKKIPDKIPRKEPPVLPKKKIYQVICKNEENINIWLQENPDIEVIDIKVCVDEYGELITVIYKTILEEK